MGCVHYLHTDIRQPERFTYPFCYEPHPLCLLAAAEVQEYISAHDEIRQDADQGKMFGVLVATQQSSPLTPHPSPLTSKPLCFLAAYSGLLAGRNDWEYFVPPVYDAQQPDGYFKAKEREISLASHPSPLTPHPSPLTPKQMSQQLQEWLFHQYRLLNARGETKDLVDVWQSYYQKEKLRRKFPLPPAGTGDCCAPKLLQYAYQHALKPVCMAEFWWGAPTRTELRQHLNYYPACRGKCRPLLTWMLQGLEVDPDPELAGFKRMDIPVVYEDEWLLAVDKPTGMLSVPGRIEDYSVETVMQQRYPGSKVAHRLDMGTSGLLLVAKTLDVYRALQEQFIRHQVRKKYIALLEGTAAANCLQRLSSRLGQTSKLDGTHCSDNSSLFTLHSSLPHSSLPTKGRISLPLRPDPMNRPRQVVDMEHGKRAVTDYEFLSENLVALYPQTGRTHQLRIHCASPDGLGRPIVGDELYGTKGDRLMLHATEIWFHHPVTGDPMHLVCCIPDKAPWPCS
jgi:tRNA pseudouridine32 synthase/23S rRNA pseudouridine746 synthase